MQNASERISEALKSGETSFLHKHLRWRFTEPIEQTLSPSSSTLLRDHISQKLRNAENYATITSAHSRAPWHPLAPISLSRLPENSDNKIRKKFLCDLTLKRLKAADPELWGKEHLAEDAAFAATIMLDLALPKLASETAKLSQELHSNPTALGILKKLSQTDEQNQ